MSGRTTARREGAERDLEMVAAWYDSPFVADRRRAFTLWSDGSLYMLDRPSPAAVWSASQLLGCDHGLGSARRMALTGHCQHEVAQGSTLGLCQWFAYCDRPARQRVAHPVIREGVPACDRCAYFAEHGEFPRAVAGEGRAV